MHKVHHKVFSRCVPDASYSLRSCTCDVISCLIALIAFPFVFVIVPSHWLVVVIVSYISLFGKPGLENKKLNLVLYAQQGCTMHKLVTVIK